MPPHPDPSPAIALVTGAGRGLGRHLALELANQGLQVAALGRKPADLESLAAEAGNGRIHPVIADVSDAGALREAFAKIDKDLGPIDTLINNAAVYPHRDFLEETPESFQQTMSINLGGMVAVSMFALERMVEQGRGRIINDWIPGALNTGMGIPDGHEPAQAARWGVSLALWRDRALTGAVFMENREELPMVSFKRRLFNKVSGQGQISRKIPPLG